MFSISDVGGSAAEASRHVLGGVNTASRHPSDRPCENVLGEGSPTRYVFLNPSTLYRSHPSRDSHAKSRVAQIIFRNPPLSLARIRLRRNE